MTMILNELAEMALDNTYECYIWDNEQEENIYTGILADIPDDLLEAEVTSWELEANKIGFNIN